MAISQVQKGTAVAVNGVTVTLGATPTQNNLLIAAHFTRAGSSIPPAGFSKVIQVDNATEDDHGAVYYKLAEASEGTSFTFGSAADFHAVQMWEYSGLDTSSISDASGTTPRTTLATALNSGTATTTQASELLIAGMNIRGTVGSPTADQSFTFDSNVGGGTFTATLLTATQIVAATAAYNTNFQWTTAQTVMGMIASFKAIAVGGANVSNYRTLMGVGY